MTTVGADRHIPLHIRFQKIGFHDLRCLQGCDFFPFAVIGTSHLHGFGPVAGVIIAVLFGAIVIRRLHRFLHLHIHRQFPLLQSFSAQAQTLPERLGCLLHQVLFRFPVALIEGFQCPVKVCCPSFDLFPCIIQKLCCHFVFLSS